MSVFGRPGTSGGSEWWSLSSTARLEGCRTFHTRARRTHGNDSHLAPSPSMRPSLHCFFSCLPHFFASMMLLSCIWRLPRPSTCLPRPQQIRAIMLGSLDKMNDMKHMTPTGTHRDGGPFGISLESLAAQGVSLETGALCHVIPKP